jgi:hypothetical protein
MYGWSTEYKRLRGGGGNPGGGEIFQTGPGAHTVSYTRGIGRGRGVNPPPNLVPGLKKE